MPTQAQADAFYNRLYASYEGRKLNPDGMYGMQCKDVPDQYQSDLFGVPLFAAIKPGNAKTVDDFVDRAYFDVIENEVGNPNSIPRLGDIIVWEGTAAGGLNPFGHVALVVSADANYVTVLQQDGFAAPLKFVNGGWYSDKPAHRAVLGYDNPGTGPCLYWLRPKLNKLRLPADIGATLPMSTSHQGATVTKKYKLETKWTTKNQVDRSFYGYGPKPTGITIHHWGNDGQTFDGVAHFLSTNDVPTSAHYVVEDGRIACLAVPERATYHAGSTAGNGSTVGIEMRPEMTKGDVDTLVQLVYELETVYGSMNIYFHREWFATACPGRYRAIRDDVIERVNAMHANGGKDPKLAVAKPAPKPAPKPAAKPKPKPAKHPHPKTENPDGYNVWRYQNKNVEPRRDAYAILRQISTDVSAIRKKIGA